MPDTRLMRLHTNALYRFTPEGKLLAANRWDGGEAPRAYLARTPDTHYWFFRHDLPTTVCDSLLRFGVPPHGDSNTASFESTCEQIVGRHAPIQEVGGGPAYAFPTSTQPDAGNIARITPSNAHLLAADMADWLPDVPHCQPFFACLEDGRAVAVCASVRISGAADEAGVETIAGSRRRGYATAVIRAWAHAVVAAGKVPLYSTSWDNQASQQVAARLGLALIGSDFHIR